MTALADLPGVGPSVAARLAKAAGGEAEAMEALRAGRLDVLRDVPGVSEARIVAWMRHLRAGPAAERLLATPAAARLHDAIVERIASFASTRRGRDRLHLIVPQADAAAASTAAAHVMEQKALAARLDRTAVTRALRQIDAPAPATPRTRTSLLVVPGDNRTAARLRDHGVHQYAIIADAGDVSAAEDFDLAVLVGDTLRDAEAAFPNAVWTPRDAPIGDIVPDSVLAPLAADRARIEALAVIADAVAASSVADDVLAALDAAPHPAAAADATATVEALRKELEAILESRIADLRLPAAEVLRAASTGRLPTDVRRVVDGVLQEGRRMLVQRTGLDCSPFLPTLPITIDDEELAAAVARRRSNGVLAAFGARQRAARTVAPLGAALRDEIGRAFDLDAELALGWFALDHDLHPPRFGDGFRFDDSVHLTLAAAPDAQRIAYRLGDDHEAARVALLTGANSGGKTTFLEHLGQLALMARLGLPVVGRGVTVPWLHEVHLVTGARGLDAGALEAFLSTFVPLAAGEDDRLVLVDEVEAVTELDAAGRILAFVLRGLAGNGALAVVATHLAPQILQHAPELRVDGIEARGLDDAHRLVVDRSPRIGHHARSTPELVVRRLAATAPDGHRSLFQDLLTHLASDPPAPTRPADGHGRAQRPARPRVLDIAK